MKVVISFHASYISSQESVIDTAIYVFFSFWQTFHEQRGGLSLAAILDPSFCFLSLSLSLTLTLSLPLFLKQEQSKSNSTEECQRAHVPTHSGQGRRESERETDRETERQMAAAKWLAETLKI